MKCLDYIGKGRTAGGRAAKPPGVGVEKLRVEWCVSQTL